MSLTKVENIDVTVREQDFVSRFAKNWDALRAILGISRPIRKTLGTKLVAYNATCSLESGSVGEGQQIPYSTTNVEEVAFEDVTIEKYAKAVSIEAAFLPVSLMCFLI